MGERIAPRYWPANTCGVGGAAGVGQKTSQTLQKVQNDFKDVQSNFVGFGAVSGTTGSIRFLFHML
jgi:hypothetical protein